jgi:Ca2+-binding EF-hand superfamily protein
MQKNNRILIAALAAVLSLPLALRAADEPKKKGPFVTADANNDGKVSLDEYVAAMKDRLDATAAKARFADLDKDKDGFLSRQEFNAGVGEKKGGDKGGDTSGEKKKKSSSN